MNFEKALDWIICNIEVFGKDYKYVTVGNDRKLVLHKELPELVPLLHWHESQDEYHTTLEISVTEDAYLYDVVYTLQGEIYEK